MEKAVKILKDKYGLNFGSYKYVLPGSEILRYIGQSVMLVHYFKNESGDWVHDHKPAVIKSLSKFDPMTMTYECVYNVEEETEDKTIRIIPEGYSFGDPEKVSEMFRFVPFSLHAEMVEDEMFFSRLSQLYDNRETLTIEELETIARSKEKEVILKYTHNIGALVKLSEGGDMLWIRLHNINIAHKRGKTWSLRIADNDRSWNMLIDSDEKEFDFNGFGTFKIIDLAERENISMEEMVKNMEQVADAAERTTKVTEEAMKTSGAAEEGFGPVVEE